MVFTYLKRIEWFVILVLLQVLILNNIHLAGYATPFLYVYFILKFKTDTSRNELMLWAFFMGLTIDIFSNTPGLNAAALVLLAFFRPLALNLFMSREAQDNIEPSFTSMGISPFVKYIITCVVLHHTALFAIESFSFFDLGSLLLKFVSSSVLTILCIMAIDGIRR